MGQDSPLLPVSLHQDTLGSGTTARVREWGPAESQEENEPFSSLSDVARGDRLSFNPPFI